ncbi:MAG: replication-associated recombination protein A [Oscillospiraceae bacterium]|jgi:putative ATPase|nr:replication-associated recombination protein A [Oscillospiraceae bacterium]
MNISLASRARPTKLTQIVGQDHLLGKEKALRKIVDSKINVNLVLYGPPGTGKTTLAYIISKKSNKNLEILNCTSAGVPDIKKIIGNLSAFKNPDGIILYLDEIQYFNKKQQQTLLEFIEDGRITLMVSTTENPYFCIHNALLSRMSVFELRSIENSEIVKALKRALAILQDDYEEILILSEDVFETIANSCSGDLRRAISTLELAVISSKSENKKIIVTNGILSQITKISNTTYDKSGDSHYNLLSGFQKSIRGSDQNASLHYLARLLESGDLLSICRRLLVCACEDVGLAYPQATTFAKSCVDIALQVGLPEAKIPLANAVILLCLSPKSNSGYKAINKAISEIKNGMLAKIPRYLQNNCFNKENNKNDEKKYKYPHDFKNHYVKQQYLPDEIKNSKYYEFGENKLEQSFKNFCKNRSGEN